MKTKALLFLLACSLALNAVQVSETVLKASAPVEDTTTMAVLDSLNRALEWETFTQALAWVESRWDDNAVGKKNDVGYLQITPILVEDANRICGQKEFTLEGRRNREESVRLFNVIMSEYNPGHDFHLALKIWNPYSKVSYHRAVMEKYRELRENQTKV